MYHCKTKTIGAVLTSHEGIFTDSNLVRDGLVLLELVFAVAARSGVEERLRKNAKAKNVTRLTNVCTLLGS